MGGGCEGVCCVARGSVGEKRRRRRRRWRSNLDFVLGEWESWEKVVAVVIVIASEHIARTQLVNFCSRDSEERKMCLIVA